jgi:methylated-DNA-[protein]-cysteine S-methyltransferase
VPTVESFIGPLSYGLNSEGELTDFWLGSKDIPGPRNELLEQQIADFFGRRRTAFDFPLAPAGTEFQLAVWNELLKIPFGETRSYAQIAKAVGRPTATRAVGAANGANPIALIIPCHRVIGSDGTLTGYGGGLPMKAALLDFERGSLFSD